MPDPNVVAHANKIANERIRPTADRLCQILSISDRVLKDASPEVDDWLTLFSQFSEKDPLVDPNQIPDPRNPVTPEAIKALVFVACQQISDLMHANQDELLNLALKVAVNPNTGL